MTAPVGRAAAGPPHRRTCLQGRRRLVTTPFLSDEEMTLARYRCGRDDSFDRAAGWLFEGMAKAFRQHGAARHRRRRSDAAVGRGPGQGLARQQGQFDRLSAGAARRSPASTSTGTSSPIRRPPGPGRSFPDDPEDVAVAKLADAIFAASRVDQDGAGRRLGNAQRRPARAHRLAQRRSASSPALSRAGHRPDGRPRRRPRMAGRRRRRPRTASPATPTSRPRKSSPRRIARRVSGHVSLTKPLSYQGTLIDNIAVRFEDGRIVEAKARSGEEVLKKVLDTDEGARRLGEVALVPHSSPISQERAAVLQHAVRRERRLPHRARPVLLEMLRRRRQADAGADRGARRQQEPHSHRLDDRLERDRHRRHLTPTAAACRCSARASGREKIAGPRRRIGVDRANVRAALRRG